MLPDDIGPARDSLIPDDVAQTLIVGIHFAVLGVLTLAVARPFLFPGLGPSAYLLAADEGGDEAGSSPYHVVGSHVVAVLGGLVGYHALASGLDINGALGATSATFSG